MWCDEYGNHMLETSYLSVLIFQKAIADSCDKSSLCEWQPTVITHALHLYKCFNLNVYNNFNVASIIK